MITPLPAIIKSRKSLRFRLMFYFIVLSAAITIAFTAYYLIYQEKSSNDHLEHEGNLILSTLKIAIRLPLYAEFREGIAQVIVRALDNKSVVGVRVFNHANQPLAEVHKPELSILSPGNLLTIREEVVVLEDVFSPEALLLGEDRNKSRMIGSIELTMNRSTVTRQLNSLYRAAMTIGLVFWLSTSLIGYFLLKHITEPMNRLIAGIKEIQNGNLAPDFNTTFDEETEQAARAVQELADSLREREAENRRLNDDLIRSMRLEVREEKRRIMAKLINTNRMTSLGLLVSSMAHEINNPNGSIRLSNEFLTRTWQTALSVLDKVRMREGEFDLFGMSYGEAREEVLQACDNIARCTVRIEHVIKNLRNYGLGERVAPEPDIDINSVVESSLSIISVHGRKLNVKIVTDLEPGLPHITGNAKQLEQVIINLVMNATQAVVEGRNEIRVSTHLEGAGGNVIVTVRDEGKGIAAEDMQRLFDPFFSTRIDEGGSGLGLYISKFIVDEHCGRITVDSEPGQGATFTLYFPVTGAPQPANRPAS